MQNSQSRSSSKGTIVKTIYWYLMFWMSYWGTSESVHKSRDQCYTDQVLELLYLDLTGPIQIEILGEKRYAFLIVDDFSKYTWVRFIREKSNTFKVFWTLCLQLQKEQAKSVRRIRSDHGREFEILFLKSSVKMKESSMNFLPLWLLSKMELLKERIVTFKKWLELYCMLNLFLYISRQKP